MLIDSITVICFAFSIILAGYLWRLALHYPGARRFWGFLALGWTINIITSLLWYLSSINLKIEFNLFINGLYFASYAFIGLALWIHPQTLRPRRLIETIILMLIAAGIIWIIPVIRPDDLGGVWPLDLRDSIITTILDIGIVYLAWRRWQSVRDGLMDTTMLWLLLSTLAYGAANLANNLVDTQATVWFSIVAPLFWLLADLSALIAGMQFMRESRINWRLQ